MREGEMKADESESGWSSGFSRRGSANEPLGFIVFSAQPRLLRDSAVNFLRESTHRRATEYAEVAQREAEAN